MRILLTDGLQRKTLVAVRSLGRAGYETLVADDTPFSLARWSRYCRRALVSPAPESPEYGDWLWRAAEQADLVLPMDDLSTAAAIACGDALGAKSLLPSGEQFATGRDKWRTAELARRAGVPHPRTVAVESHDELAEARNSLGGDVVVRPRVGSGGRGVRFLAEGDPMPQEALRGHIAQERIPPGRKFDVGLLYGRDGTVRAVFCQEELRWFPGEQGTSTLQRSVLRQDVVDLSLRLLQPLGWRGLVEVEWVLAPDGTPRLLEINPRAWASLGLAVAAGVDFPRLWAELALGCDAHGPETYDTHVVCRWTLPADLLHLLRHPLRRFAKGAPQLGPGDRTVDDVLDRQDLGPLPGFLLAVVGHLFDVETWRQVMRW